MNKFFRKAGIVAVVLAILGLIVGFVIWDMQLLTPRRETMQYVVPPPVDTPFEVKDRHQDTRDWIEDRLNATPAPTNIFRPEPSEDEPPQG